jgi:hypothetical protein
MYLQVTSATALWSLFLALGGSGKAAARSAETVIRSI